MGRRVADQPGSRGLRWGGTGAVIVGLTLTVCGVAVAQGNPGSPPPTTAVQTAGSTPTATAPATPSASAPATSTAPTTAAADPVAAAQAVKPLRDLVEGDRVLYIASPGAPGTPCTWVLWNESIATSTIRCGAEQFEVPTGYLAPVEAR